MALRPISEQQFRTRRKDRRMVWVDAVAVLVGMLMLVATVGGVVLVEPEPKPIPWDYTFFEGTEKHKHCAGLTGAREGCTQIVDARSTPEGETIETFFDPITKPNVTSIIFTLSWVDNVPVTEEPDCQGHKYGECGRSFTYDEESTDEFLLTVTPPNGEPMSINGTNDINTKFGSISLVWEFVEMPETGQVDAFSQEEALADVIERFTQPQHDALGEWSATVTLVRAGDQEGTVPLNPCDDAVNETGEPTPDPLADPVDENCYTDTHQKTLEDSLAGDLLTDQVYTSSFDDEEQSWILEMAIRAYDVQVSVG